MRFSFWESLLNTFKEDRGLSAFKNISPTKDTFIAAGSGVGGLQWTIWLNKDKVRCELRIDKGKECDEENLSIFNKLKEHKQSVDASYGPGLNWDEMIGYRVCSIRTEIEGGWNNPENQWPDIIANVADAMRKMIASLHPVIRTLR